MPPGRPPIVRSDPDVLGGTPVFAGTLVPVHALIDTLLADHTLSAFLEVHPSVTREQAVAALEIARHALHQTARGAG